MSFVVRLPFRAKSHWGRLLAAAIFAAVAAVDVSGGARAGFFEELFGGFGGSSEGANEARRAPVHAPRPKKRLANRRAKLASLEAAQRANGKNGEEGATIHAICVRMCDGVIFPAPELTAKDPVRRQASCASACPDAPMRRFTMSSAAEDVAKARDEVDGGAYGELVNRLKRADSPAPNSCGCGVAANDTPPIRPEDFLADDTLRSGDVVVTSDGLRIFTGERDGEKHHRPAFLALAQMRELPKATQGALTAIEKAIKTPRGRN
jgi:hypothetical protein